MTSSVFSADGAGNAVRVNVIGRWEQFPPASRNALERLAANTARNDGLILNLAVNYSARAELRDAVRRMMDDVRAGRPVLPEKQLARRLSADPRVNSREYPLHPAQGGE